MQELPSSWSTNQISVVGLRGSASATLTLRNAGPGPLMFGNWAASKHGVAAGRLMMMVMAARSRSADCGRLGIYDASPGNRHGCPRTGTVIKSCVAFSDRAPGELLNLKSGNVVISDPDSEGLCCDARWRIYRHRLVNTLG